MLSNLSKLQVVIENKAHQYMCDADTSLSHIKEALFQFQKYVGQVEDNIKAQLAQAEAEKKALEPQEESIVEEFKAEEPKAE